MKERLIGAAVLVALAVWLIPWVLDGPDGPEPVVEADSGALELPAAESSSAVRTQTIQLDETREPPTPAPRSEPSAVPSPRPVPAPTARTLETRPADEPLESAVSQAVDVVPEPTRVAAPEPTARPEPTASPEPAVSQEPSSSPATPVPADGEAWMVQIGSFSEEENAHRLAARVGTFGFSARVSTFAGSGRPMFRVRIGPEPSRERAVAVASSLTAHGFVAQVVSQD